MKEGMIEKERVLDTLQGLLFKHRDDAQKYDGIHAAFAAVAALPTVDAVPVIRCKECVYWQSDENEAEKWEYCRRHHIGIGPHSFCSYGERSGNMSKYDRRDRNE